VLNYLSNMPWRNMGEWRYSFTFLDLGEVGGQLHAPAA
jgi:hypothetical protein